MPIPAFKDIPLPQPAPEWLLVSLIIVSFLAHILFVLLMVGGSVLALACEIIGLKRREFDEMAREIGRTITVNKSLAVVLGVAPLLIINTLYTVFFYSANALTGTAWTAILPMVIVAFLLSYAHEYSWDRFRERKALHISILFASTALFLTVPLVFLANINLMLYPEWWGRTSGFLSALLLPNAIPRYFHFITASVAVTALFLIWYMGRKAFAADRVFGPSGRGQFVRFFYTTAFLTTGAQLFFGPLLYFTLPAQAVDWPVTIVIFSGATVALAAIWMLYLEAMADTEESGRRFWHIIALLTTVVLLMGVGRHLARESALSPHRAAMEARTVKYMAAVEKARDFRVVPGGLGAGISRGESVFKSACGACHAREERLVGPPLAEIALIYKGNPAGIVAWSKNPGKKRSDYPPMPPQKIPDKDLEAAADFILKSGAGE